MKLATEFGCFGCHGANGVQGIADPSSPGGRVPGWDFRTVEMYVTCENDIREWILHGQPNNEFEEGAPSSSEFLVPMPAYGELINQDQLDDLVAYFLAVSGWHPDLPDPVYEGRKIATDLGCFGCHGPSGIGGVPSPGSQTGFVVPWDGEGFAELVANDEELREWILFGQIPDRLDGSPEAEMLRKQILQMPPYRGYLSDLQLERLIVYINWLRGKSTWEEEAVHVIG